MRLNLGRTIIGSCPTDDFLYPVRALCALQSAHLLYRTALLEEYPLAREPGQYLRELPEANFFWPAEVNKLSNQVGDGVLIFNPKLDLKRHRPAGCVPS